ncbi:MAG: hypothetical protein ABL879_16365 [Devosia sp.]
MADPKPDNIVPFRKLKRGDPKRLNGAPEKPRGEPRGPLTISPVLAFGAIVVIAVAWVLVRRLFS